MRVDPALSNYFVHMSDNIFKVERIRSVIRGWLEVSKFRLHTLLPTEIPLLTELPTELLLLLHSNCRVCNNLNRRP